MSALGVPVLINPNRSYWISSISDNPTHNTITANSAFFSTLSVSDVAQISTLKASSFQLTDDLNASTIFTSSFFTNFGKFSTIQWDSDLSGGTGTVNITSDPSGVLVTGDPIVFNNLVYLTSTINIVQVSTLVDTDIFAQKGYISSISSLNISANTAGIRQAYISTLTNNTILTNDISGYLAYFSTLSTGSLSAGVVSIRQANISTLYVSSLEGVDISGAQPTDWANYPAINTILANNNSITGISTLQFQDASRLYSLTGNNLFYNGQPIQYGAGSNVSQWAQYPAVRDVNLQNSSITNANFMTASNLTLLGSNITSGNTFTGSLGVGGTSLISLASINGLGQGVLQDLDVGTTLTGIGDLNVYGSNALPGDNALYVVGGTTLTGGLTGGVPVHGTEIGALPVAGVDTVRIDVLPAGMGLNSATYIQLACGGAGSFASGGALSLAGGSYIELNSDEIRCINTTSGNKNTTLTVGNILSPPDIAGTSSITIQNIAGGGIQLQAGGQGSVTGFSTIQGSNLSSINLDVSTINGLNFQSVVTPSNIVCSNVQATISVNTQIANINSNYFNVGFWNQGIALSTTIGALRVNNIQIPDNITGVTNAPNPNQSRLLNFSTVNSFNVSTTDLWVSSINGLTPGGGGGGNVFNSLFTSSLAVSTIEGVGFGPEQITRIVGNGLLFQNPAPTFNSRYISSLQYLTTPGENLYLYASTIDITANQGGSNGYIRIGGGAFNDTFINNVNNIPTVSTAQIIGNSTIAGEITTSSIRAVGGLPLKVGSVLEFITPSAVDNCYVINLNPLNIPQLDVQASTIVLGAVNTTTQSFSTLRQTVSSLSFSTATSVGSNTAYNYPLFIDYDQGGNTNAGVAIAVQGHNYGTGAVVNRIEMGCRGNGENYIATSWPGQNLEDLIIEATQVNIRDSDGFSTIINENPYGIQTNGIAKVGAGSEVVVISTNSVKVGGVTQMTGTAISSVIVNTPYGNNLYYAGVQQPCILHGWSTFGAGGGYQPLQIDLPLTYDEHIKPFDVQLTYRNGVDNSPLYWSTTGTGSSFVAWGAENQEFSWTTFGDLPFTG